MQINQLPLNQWQASQLSDANTEKEIGQKIEELKSSAIQELGKDLFAQLKPGQSFQGQIVDIQSNMVKIQLANVQLNARIDGELNFSIGDNLFFLVKENEENHIVLSPIIEQNISPQDQAMYKALDAAGLPATDKNIDVVSELIKHQLPVDKRSIQYILEKSYANPEAKISDLVLMTKHQILINPENIEQFVHYQNQEHQLANDIIGLAEKLPDVLEKLLETEQEIPSLLEQVKDTIKTLQNQENITKEELVILLKDEHFRTELTEHFVKQWTMEASKLDAEEVNSKLGKLIEETNKILHLFEQIPSEDKEVKSLFHTAENIKNNVSFLENLNENFIYTQLPLKFQQQITHGELYVYADKRKKVDIKEGISLFLHLDMEYLGGTDISIYLKENKVQAKFSVFDQKSAAILEENIIQLSTSLEKKGYLLTAQIEKKEEEKTIDFVEDFLEHGEQKRELKRFSFDIRV